MSDGPLIVQSDKTLLLEVDHPLARECRAAIAPFAELERSPEHVHTYRVTPLALWNARAAGHDAEQVVDALVRLLPLSGAARAAGRRRRHHGPLRPAHPGQQPGARAGADDVGPRGARGGRAVQAGRPDAGRAIDADSVIVHAAERGRLKQALLKIGWPAEDLAGYVDGAAHPIELDQSGWHLRDYQQEAVDGFWAGARASSSSRVARARRWSAPRPWPRRRRPR